MTIGWTFIFWGDMVPIATRVRWHTSTVLSETLYHDRNFVPKRSKVDFERRPESIPLNPSVPRPWYTPEFEILRSQKVVAGSTARVLGITFIYCWRWPSSWSQAVLKLSFRLSAVTRSVCFLRRPSADLALDKCDPSQLAWMSEPYAWSDASENQVKSKHVFHRHLDNDGAEFEKCVHCIPWRQTKISSILSPGVFWTCSAWTSGIIWLPLSYYPQ
jgi:hypothetical protein